MRRTTLVVGMVVGVAGASVGPTAAQPPARPHVQRMTGVTNAPANAKTDPEQVARGLRAPAGFRASVWARGLGGPRIMAVGDDGTVYVTRRDSNDVLALRDDGSGRAGAPRKVVANLRRVHGIALHQGTMYLATVHEIYAAEMRPDGTVGEPRAIVTDLPEGAQHPNRTIGVGPDGMLYVSVGSTCNRCVETNPENATMVRMALDGSRRGVFAHGLRNTIGWSWHPETRELWGMDHGSDWSGNDLPPEELNRIQPAHYGWPFCYGRRAIDSLFIGMPQGLTREEFCARSAAAALTYRAHSAPIQGAFYTGAQFPAAYRNDFFIAMRGSWNREQPSGYEVARVRFQGGRPVAIEPFVTGFLSADRRQFHARLAGLAVARDGALLVGDDTNGVIYRIAYVGSGAP